MNHVNSTFIILIGVILFFFSGSRNAFANSECKEEDKIVSIALSSRPSNLNPFFATDANSQNINRLVHLSLVDFNDQMEFECRLCKSFEEHFLDDGGYKISFKLRDDFRFWDGTPVRAIDVLNSWKYFSDEEKIRSVFRFAFQNIKKINVKNESELDIYFDQFYLDALSNLVLMKVIKIEGDFDEAPDLSQIVGAGSYQLSTIRPLSIELVPIDASAKVLDFKVVRDETTLALKLINGEIDFSVAHMSPRKIDWLRDNHPEKLNFWEVDTSNFIYLSINHRREVLSQKKVRKALAMLTPRDKIIKYKLRGNAIRSEGMFSPAFGALYTGEDVNNVYNPEKGIKILKDLGYSESNPLVLDWKTPSTRSTQEIVRTISDFWERGPVRVEITVQEWGTFMRSFRQGRYDIVLGQWIGFTGPEMLDFAFHSEKIPPHGGNRGHFINEEVDRLLSKAEKTQDSAKRVKIFNKVSNIINEQFAYINLWHPRLIWKSSSCVEIPKMMPNGSFGPFLNITKECCREQ